MTSSLPAGPPTSAPAPSVPLTPAAAAIALPATAYTTYSASHWRRVKLQHWLATAERLSVGYADLSLSLDGSNADELAALLKTRCAAVRLVLKRAAYNERRRALRHRA